MTNICIKRQHQIGKLKAREKMEVVADTLKRKLDAECTWEGDTMNFTRSGASGCIDIGEDFLEFNIELSMLLTPLKGTIESVIHEELDKSLA